MAPLTICGFACLLLVIATGSQALTIDGVEEQCKSKRSSPNANFLGACKNYDHESDICAGLRCAYQPHTSEVYWGRPTEWPLEGTKCGENKICWSGRCKDVTPAEMPTYNGSEATYQCIMSQEKVN